MQRRDFLKAGVAGTALALAQGPTRAQVEPRADVKGADATNHDKFVQLASVAPELRGILARGINSNHRGTDASERAASGVGSIVALPLTLLGAPVRIIAGQ